MALRIPTAARRVAYAIELAGGRAWLVGGWVRDQLLGRESNDLDLEAGGLDADELELALSALGPVIRVGRAFPVFKLKMDGMTLDISQPRADSLPDGQVSVDPDLPVEESAARRDLRINAIAIDPLTEELCDPFDGQGDLQRRQLRAVDAERFLDDPLRVLRAARFAAQLNFKADDQLVEISSRADWSLVASERIGIELCRLLRAPFPHQGLYTGCRLGVWSALLKGITIENSGPELCAMERMPTIGPRLGPESRALAVALAILLHRIPASDFDHTMDRLDIYRKEGLDLRNEIEIAIGRYQELAENCDRSSLLWAAESGELAISLGLALALQPSDTLSEAIKIASELGVLHTPVLPLIMGRDLVDIGVEPGAALGRLLESIRSAQLDGRISTPEEAQTLALELLQSSKT